MLRWCVARQPAFRRAVHGSRAAPARGRTELLGSCSRLPRMKADESPSDAPRGAELLRTQTYFPMGKAIPASPERAAYVLVFEGDVAYRLDFPKAGTVIAGRAPDATLRLDQSGASRHHARFDVQQDGVWLSDMESRNGTRCNGELVRTARLLSPGDIVDIAGATLIFQQQATDPGLRTLLSLSQLRLRLEEELDRAVRYHRSLVLLAVELGEGNPAPKRGEIVECLAGLLRSMDSAAWHAHQTLFLLCPELSPSEGENLAQRMQSRLASLSPAIAVRLAACPRDGTTVQTLFAACAQPEPRDAKSPSGPEPSAPPSSVRRIGKFQVIVADAAMRRLYGLLERLAASELPILLQGETGTGKELAAAAVHHFSKRKERSFITLNCAAIPENLVESELFGHERGAFSGAVQSKLGQFEAAHGGTLFLDEIGELALPIQAKLLRVLETRRLQRVGDVKERACDVRVVAASHRDLQAEVAAGRFRQDLFFRLAAARVYLPPLRDRGAEIPILARSFLRAACEKLGRPEIEIAPTCLHLLSTYAWPGNIRELRNVMDFAAASSEEDVLLPYHVLPQLQLSQAAAPAGSQMPAAPISEPGSAQPPRHSFRPIEEELRALERQRMIEALEASHGVHVRAAALISMPIRTFTGKLKTYQIATRERPSGATTADPLDR